MSLCPAVHIAYFGVFPDRPVTADLRESLSAEKAARQVQSENHNAGDAFNLWQSADRTQRSKGFVGRFHVGFNNVAAEKILATAGIRMRSAYSFAAKQGWVQPMASSVFIPGFLHPETTHNARETLEAMTLGAFHDHLEGARPMFTHAPIALKEKPVAIMAHIRCVIDGEARPFLSASNATHVFKSTCEPYLQADLDPEWFDLDPIDTVRHFPDDPLHNPHFMLGFARGGHAPA